MIEQQMSAIGITNDTRSTIVIVKVFKLSLITFARV